MKLEDFIEFSWPPQNTVSTLLHSMYVLTVFEPNKVGIEKERMPVRITKNFWNPF